MSSRDALPVGEVLVYQAPDGQARVDVRLERETVWLSLTQMAELFGRDKSVIRGTRGMCSTRKSCTEGQLLQEMQQLQRTTRSSSSTSTQFYRSATA